MQRKVLQNCFKSQVPDVVSSDGPRELVRYLAVHVGLEEVEHGEVEPGLLPDPSGSLAVGQGVVVQKQSGKQTILYYF